MPYPTADAPPPQFLSWRDPLDLAAAIREPWWVLLYSGARTDYSGRYSYLAYGLAERIESADFTALAEKLSAGGHPYGNAWFGYLGYGLKNSLETLPPDAPGWLELPPLTMMRFRTLCRFDHDERTLTCWSKTRTRPPMAETPVIYPPGVSSLQSNMSRAEYLEKAAQVIECIRRGDLYQANLTRKFIGEFTSPPDAFALFARLCAVSPAPYSAFLRLGGTSILSSSPELFLKIDAGGQMRARPIKGTAPRSDDPARDRQLRDALAASAKDRAENLMIADLMRNDFSRSCVPGSVGAESLFDVTSHATIHHLSSTITGKKHHGRSTIEAVKACFPPGSMTGAPKIRAMQLCSELERRERGVYSGAIGWFGGDGSCELSVVIRTLVLRDKRFEFQVGGGIVADSTPEGELQEMMDKSRGILAALGLSIGDLPA